jgi:hypothetical protein
MTVPGDRPTGYSWGVLHHSPDSPAKAREMFAGFSDVRVTSELGPGDLLLGAAGQRHRGALLVAARRLYPRWAIRRLLSAYGLYLLIEATRPAASGGGP